MAVAAAVADRMGSAVLYALHSSHTAFSNSCALQALTQRCSGPTECAALNCAAQEKAVCCADCKQCGVEKIQAMHERYNILVVTMFLVS